MVPNVKEGHSERLREPDWDGQGLHFRGFEYFDFHVGFGARDVRDEELD